MKKDNFMKMLEEGRKLLDGDGWKEFDPEGALRITLSYPENFEKALAEAASRDWGAAGSGSRSGAIKNVIIAGLGGSAIAGDLASSYLSRYSRLPITIRRTYDLPSFANQETLLIAISYSGNTEETLAATEEGLCKGAKVVSISSGGKLKEMADVKGFPHIPVPTGFQPRASLPFLIVPILYTLMPFCDGAFDPAEEITRAIKTLRERAKSSSPDIPSRENLPKSLALEFRWSLPIIYGVSGVTDVVAYRWRTQINENAKQYASSHTLPELDHNELVAIAEGAPLVLGGSQADGGYVSGIANSELFARIRQSPIAIRHSYVPLVIVSLSTDFDHPGISKRVPITRELVLGAGALEAAPPIRWQEVRGRGEGGFAQIMDLLLTGDLASIYLAFLNGVDPTPVKVITRLKELISEKKGQT